MHFLFNKTHQDHPVAHLWKPTILHSCSCDNLYNYTAAAVTASQSQLSISIMWTRVVTVIARSRGGVPTFSYHSYLFLLARGCYSPTYFILLAVGCYSSSPELVTLLARAWYSRLVARLPSPEVGTLLARGCHSSSPLLARAQYSPRQRLLLSSPGYSQSP